MQKYIVGTMATILVVFGVVLLLAGNVNGVYDVIVGAILILNNA